MTKKSSQTCSLFISEGLKLAGRMHDLASRGEGHGSRAELEMKVAEAGISYHDAHYLVSPSILHAINIATLSSWMSLAGFASVGVCISAREPRPAPVDAELSVEIEASEFHLGNLGDPSDTIPVPPEPSPTENPNSASQTLPMPPELPPQTDFQPLPEVPDLPASSPVPKSTVETPRRNDMTQGAAQTANARPPTRSEAPSEAAAADTSVASVASRLAAGKMPAPVYPAAARRAGQSGTVIVEFTVDTSGLVITAQAVKPCPWPLLNEAAVRTVRRWKFPAGSVMKIQRPIVFQLR
jgi:protein TonB